MDLADRGEQRREHLFRRDAQGEVVDGFELVDAGEAVAPDELGVVLAEAFKSEDGIFGNELTPVQRGLVLPVHVRLDVVDEVEVIDDLGQLRHRGGEHAAVIDVVEVVVDREHDAVGAAVVGDRRVEDAAVANPAETEDASGLRAAVCCLSSGLLRFLLLLGGRGLGLLPLRLLFGLLFSLLLLRGLLLLRLRRGRLCVIVVIVAAADQRQSRRADAGTRRGAQQRAPRHPLAPHPLPVVPLVHQSLVPESPAVSCAQRRSR